LYQGMASAVPLSPFILELPCGLLVRTAQANQTLSAASSVMP